MKIPKFIRKILGGTLKKVFVFFQFFGIHITRVHYYQPIPDTRKLGKKNLDKKFSMTGLKMNSEKQIDLLKLFEGKYKKEYESVFKSTRDGNGSIGPVDTETLYSMVRYLKPKRIIEIGSGYSTLMMAKAILKNKEDGAYDCQLESIDPYPANFIEKGFDGFSKLIKKEVQEIPVEYFNKLEENDILFVDTSHVLKIGGDVQYEYLEIIPNLNKGVFVHIHDIFMPKEYPEKWIMEDHTFWNEQYLLQAFLAFNSEFEIILATNFLHQKFPELFEKFFSSYDRLTSSPGSFWIKRNN